MINRYLSLVFLFFLVTACYQKQALLQRGFVQEFQQTSAPQKKIEFLNKNFSNVKNNTSILNHKIKTDTLDIKPDTLPPVKGKLIISSDTLIPKPSNIDSILVKNEKIIDQVKGDKIAKQARNFGIFSLIFSVFVLPLGLITGAITIMMAKKATKLGTKKTRLVKNAILMGKISIVYSIIGAILSIIALIYIIYAINSLFT